jgi:hypothetical protein
MEKKLIGESQSTKIKFKRADTLSSSNSVTRLLSGYIDEVLERDNKLLVNINKTYDPVNDR